jgi:hypothetical protein
MRLRRPRAAPWTRLLAWPLVAVIVIQSTLGASLAVAKEFAVVGIVDCGVSSGRACPAGTTVIGIRTDQISGKLQTFKVDLAWVLKQTPTLHQDDQLCLEVRDDARSDGVLQVISVVEKCDEPVRRAKSEKDENRGATTTSSPDSRVLALTCSTRFPDPDAETTIGTSTVTTFTVEMGEVDGFGAYLIDPLTGDFNIKVFYEGVEQASDDTTSGSDFFAFFNWGTGASTQVTFVVTALTPGASGRIHVFCNIEE